MMDTEIYERTLKTLQAENRTLRLAISSLLQDILSVRLELDRVLKKIREQV